MYVLRSLRDGKRYVGMAEDYLKRKSEHDAGRVQSTKGRRPFEIEYVEEVGSRQEAREREKYFKTAAGRRHLDKVLKAGPVAQRIEQQPSKL